MKIIKPQKLEKEKLEPIQKIEEQLEEETLQNKILQNLQKERIELIGLKFEKVEHESNLAG